MAPVSVASGDGPLKGPLMPFIGPVDCADGAGVETFAPIFVACDLHISTALTADLPDDEAFVIGIYDFVFGSKRTTGSFAVHFGAVVAADAIPH